MKKRQVFIISLVVMSIVAVLLLPYISQPDRVRDGTAGAQDQIVVIYLTGTIAETGGGLFGGGITPRLVHSQLERAANDRSIKGVVLRIESPGGSIAASQEISNMIGDFEKPLVVSMADMAASGGYYISARADAIVAQPGTLTGSIGVISSVMNYDGLYEMLGIEVETFKTGLHKDMFSRPLTEEEREIMQNISDQAYDQFINDIAAGRGMPVQEVRKVATGQLYLGSQALELGLVDYLGGLDDAITYLAELNGFENPARYEFPQPSPFVQLFDYSYSALDGLKRSLTPPELIMLDMIREGFPPDIRYQVR